MVRTLEDLRRNPTHVTATELLAVFAAHRWQAREGTTHGTIVRKGVRTLLIPRPHGKHLLPIYVKRAIKILEEEERER